MPRVVVFDDRKAHDAILVRELRLAQNLVEELRHVFHFGKVKACIHRFAGKR